MSAAGFALVEAVQAKAQATYVNRIGRLLRAAERAQVNNPWTLPPWKTATAWTIAEVLPLAGVIRSNAGNWYVSQVGGTTGITAPTHTSGAGVSDGGVFWFYVGPAESAADDGQAPTITTSTSAPGGFANTWLTAGSGSGYLPNALRPVGGYVTNPASNATLTSFTSAPGTTRSRHNGWEFETDEDSVVVKLNFRYSTVQLIIDGRRVSPDGVTGAGTGTHFIRIDFNNGRRVHTVKVLFNVANGMNMPAVLTKSTGQIWAPRRDHIVAAFLGDSHWDGSGYGPYTVGGSEPERIADLLGIDSPWDYSIGGTGEIAGGTAASGSASSIAGNTLTIGGTIAGAFTVGMTVSGANVTGTPTITALGTGSGGAGTYTINGPSQTAASASIVGAFYTYGQRVSQIIALRPDIVFIEGSFNDPFSSQSAIQAAALATMAAIRAGLPNAIIVRYGVIPTAAGTVTTEASIKAACQQMPDFGVRTFFIPWSVDTVTGLPWITISGVNNSANTASINSTLVGGTSTDGTHKSDIGIAYMARREAQAVLAQVYPLLAAQ